MSEQCQGTTRGGEPCQRTAEDGRDYCYQHPLSQSPSPEYEPERVALAIREADGNLSEAARVIGCNRKTVTRYCNRYEVCQTARDDARNEIVDLARDGLRDRIGDGDTSAIKYALDRYDDHTQPDKVEVSGPDGGPIETDNTHEVAPDNTAVLEALELLHDDESADSEGHEGD